MRLILDKYPTTGGGKLPLILCTLQAYINLVKEIESWTTRSLRSKNFTRPNIIRLMRLNIEIAKISKGGRILFVFSYLDTIFYQSQTKETRAALLNDMIELYKDAKKYIVDPNEKYDIIKVLSQFRECNARRISKWGMIISFYGRQFTETLDRLIDIYDLGSYTTIAGPKFSSLEMGMILNRIKKGDDITVCAASTTFQQFPATHRRAAIEMLVCKCLGATARNTDRTQLAKVVEALAGGNIAAKPKNMTAYKKPTSQAEKAAAELLQSIGIE